LQKGSDMIGDVEASQPPSNQQRFRPTERIPHLKQPFAQATCAPWQYVRLCQSSSEAVNSLNVCIVFRLLSVPEEHDTWRQPPLFPELSI
jgi:hypothetical protein